MMTYWHKCNVWSTSSTNSIPMMTTSLFLTMLAHTWSEQRMLSLPAICLRALNIGWWRPRSAVRTAKSCITQMANWLRYAFPWAMHALQMAPPRPPHTSRFIQGHGCHSWRMQHPCRMCWLQVPKGSQWWIWLCCCQHILFNEPDFVNVPSLLSSLCAETVSQPSSSPNFLPNSIPLSNVGDMQSGFIVNSPHWAMLGICKVDLLWIPTFISHWRCHQKCSKGTCFCPSGMHSEVSLPYPPHLALPWQSAQVPK